MMKKVENYLDCLYFEIQSQISGEICFSNALMIFK